MADSYANRFRALHLVPAWVRRKAKPAVRRSGTVLPEATMAKIAALLFFLGGTIGMIANFAVAPPDHPWQLAILGPAAAVCGAVAWLIPWGLWPRIATLWPVALTMVFLTLGATAGMDAYSYGAFFTLIFTWIGITQQRGTPALFALPAALAYVLPTLLAGKPLSEVTSVFTVIPVCVLVGEALAWISQRLKTAREQLNEALSVKDDFIALTTHELNTPLTSILGFSSTLVHKQDHFSREQEREFIETIERNAQALRRMVGNLVALADRSPGQMSLNVSVLEVRPFIDRILYEHFPEESKALVIDCPDGLSILADTEKIKMMLINYISNALKYGAAPITIGYRDLGNLEEWMVSDVGQGVPEWFVPKLFEKFTQEKDSVSRNSRGLGIGLSLVQALAHTYGGKAWYEPNQPQGAKFGFSVPKPSLAAPGTRMRP